MGVRLNFDVAVYGDDPKGNGAFTQNVLNVEAVGTASTDGDGFLTIDSLGAFEVAVNGVDSATSNFRLRLQAPAGAPGGDSTAPTIVAQYPSACSYTFGLGYDEPIGYWDVVSGQTILDENGDPIPGSEPDPTPDADNSRGVFPSAQRNPTLDVAADAPEDDCADYLANVVGGISGLGGVGNGLLLVAITIEDEDAPLGARTFEYLDTVHGINNVLPEESLSVTFSEPVDPASLTDIDGNPDTGHLQLMGPAGDVPVNLQVQGSTVVIDPVETLDYQTEYTLTVGTGVSDLAGNPLTNGKQIVINTPPYVPSTDGGGPIREFFGTVLAPNPANIVQTAPFLTTLYPGLPCALDAASGDFRTGGDTAGYCVGNDTDSSAPQRAWPVFDLPANRAVHMVFSKPVQSDTMTLANGCLTATDGSAAVVDNGGTIAVQVMDGSGNCTGVAEGNIVFPHPGDGYTRKANFRPAEPWQDGQRYWLVLCADGGDSTCAGDETQTILDVDNGAPATTRESEWYGFPTHDGRLNTTPMVGTGTNQVISVSGVPGGVGNYPAAGGPDLVMPFDGAPASEDQFLVSELKPFTDVNGNGFADGIYRVPQTGFGNYFIPGFDFPPEATERRQQANSVRTQVAAADDKVYAGRQQESTVAYQSGAQPAAVGAVTEDCPMPTAVSDMIGTTPPRCAPVTIYPGGLVAQTGIILGSGPVSYYGRTLLHSAGVEGQDATGNPTTVPQTGYIVDRCQGSYRINGIGYSADGSQPFDPDQFNVVGGNIQEYDYSPCFVLSQKLLFTADHRTLSDGSIGKAFAPQEGLTVNLVGEVSFERNGRLVIRATNTNDVKLKETLYPNQVNLDPDKTNPVLIPSGAVNLQLVGPAIHGGPLGAFKTQ